MHEWVPFGGGPPLATRIERNRDGICSFSDLDKELAMRDMRDFRSAADEGSDRKLIVVISIAVLLLVAAIAAAFWFWKQNQHRQTAPVVAESAPPAPTEAPAAPPIAMA